MSGKIILVTGATSGFGKAIAEKFAAAGWNCIITGRRKEKLEELASHLQNQYKVNILPLTFDVQDREATTTQLQQLPAEWQQVDVLVNNAGLALGRDTFDAASLDDWDTMINTNVKGLLYVSKAVVPYMIANGKGHIINIGSTAGKEVYPNGNVYCASKHAVDAISKSQRIDLLPHSIKVTAVHPGAAETEFSDVRFKGDASKAKAVYDGYEPLHAADVADIVFYAANLPAHVCINDLVVTCTAQANSFFTHKNS
ncbi:NADP-dependent 3-hydroxy acid dehydrogenase YdfG [Filimonas lacunae]|uniref:NADP-dependent 3-hydroxy acid dehydrogenase YdfG n=1 Tax=Filimonas lacunae TaxID=477680 RepID=A0A173M9H2_9BACT|nr:SDR family NAD(P)-dependent oxidoreductase [Filimonas lacunae]BAV04194.1 oxidoreductase, short chain dehydrogenase/reductase family [Filimonas lacunae]SIT14387.1 NADP-dependent 3-hydroxy acid dehydrogenase YdfG [Filimonas lacunae]